MTEREHTGPHPIPPPCHGPDTGSHRLVPPSDPPISAHGLSWKAIASNGNIITNGTATLANVESYMAKYR